MARGSSSETILHLYLLGSFCAELNGQTIHFPTRKVEALLAYLVLHPEPHPREKLAALLWGDSSDELARRSLRTALASLRQRLGDDLLLADRETVQLNPDFPLWFDVHEFELAATDDPQSAITLYQGDLLPDLYDDWVLQERERLHALYLNTLLQLAQDARSQSQYARAIELAQKVLANDAANEKAYQHIIFCLAAQGDRVVALKQYDECQKKLRDELGVEPSRETRALRDQIEQQSTGKSREALYTNLPHPLTSFIGRENEIAEVKSLLLQHRLMTLTGSGGCGKTRLAIEVASQLVESFQNGAWWVDLAPLTNASLVPQTVMQALGLHETPKQSLDETLVSFLRGKHLLLILDNCEHLITACAQLVDKLLSACSQLTILATSREALSITGEMTWRVPSLALPDAEITMPTEQLKKYDAMRLFAERAKTIAPNWSLADHTLAVAHICRRLDGIPLAVELAGARMKMLSVDQIAIRLDDRFNLLTGGSRTALPRQQTLRATMDWSYDLLSRQERIMFRRLAVFAGGWTLPAAETIGPNEEIEKNRVLELLSDLADKSIVVVEENAGLTRYRMLETIREYAREKLDASRELSRMRNRHLRFFAEFAENAEPYLRSSRQIEWIRRLAVEMDNFRAALGWSIEEHQTELALRLVAALGWFWRTYQSDFREARNWFDRVLSLPAAPSYPDLFARALYGAGTLAYMHSNTGRALLEESVALARRHSDPATLAHALDILGLNLAFDNENKAAHAYLEESRALFRDVGDEWGIAVTLFHEHKAFENERNVAKAQECLEQSLKLFMKLGDSHRLGLVLRELSRFAFDRGDVENGRELLRQALVALHRVGSKGQMTECLRKMAELAQNDGDHQRALLLLAATNNLYEIIGTQTANDKLEFEEKLAEYRGTIGNTMLTAILERARHTSINEIVEYAIGNQAAAS